MHAVGSDFLAPGCLRVPSAAMLGVCGGLARQGRVSCRATDGGSAGVVEVKSSGTRKAKGRGEHGVGHPSLRLAGRRKQVSGEPPTGSPHRAARFTVVTQLSRRPATTRKGEDRRASILIAAGRLFAEQGYRGSSLDSVASAVGLTRAGLLHYFPSKETLLVALLEDRYHDDGRRFAGGLAEDQLPLLPALQRLIEHNQGSKEAVKLFTVLVAESVFVGHPGHDYFAHRYQKIRSRLEDVLRSEQSAGTVRDDVDLSVLVPVIVAVMDGLQTQWLFDDEVDMLSSFQLFSQLVSTALIPTSSTTRAKPPGGRAAHES